MKKLIRYEILIPQYDNCGKVFPTELLEKTNQEIFNKFGAVSNSSSIITGIWINCQGEISHDHLARLFVDVEDTTSNLAWFIKHKETWKERFQQDEIWLVCFPVEVI